VESGTGVEWVFSGLGERCGGGMCGVRDWIGDAGIDFVAFYAVRMYRVAADVWHGAANWSDGA
jgi:hypothetical protein